jgi:hypothetical protein
MKKPSRKLMYALQRVLNRMVEEGIVSRHRRLDRPKGKRGQAPYVYSWVKR